MYPDSSENLKYLYDFRVKAWEFISGLFESVLGLMGSRVPCEMGGHSLIWPSAWGALNPTKTFVSRCTQNVQHQGAWGGCGWEDWQGALGVIGDAWLCGHQGSGRAGSTSYPAAIDVYNTLPLCSSGHLHACQLLSPHGSGMRAQAFRVLFPAGNKVLAKKCFDFSPRVCPVTCFSCLHCTLSVYPCVHSPCQGDSPLFTFLPSPLIALWGFVY